MNHELEVMCAKLLADLPDIVKRYEWLARLQRAKYEALIAAGFTEQQALTLSKDV